MKLRLSQVLMLFVLGASGLNAAVMHSDVSLQTYVDFASNAGRYAVGATNELLDYIRKTGVKIEYSSGAEAKVLPHGMISFDSVVDLGNATLTNYNYLVTVKHNGTLDPTFGANKYGVGAGNSIVYKGIEEEGANRTFVLDATVSDADYKLIRLSKLVTDATSASLFTPPIIDGKTDMQGELVYRVGGGNHQVKDYNGNTIKEYSGGDFSVGGIGYISHWQDKTAITHEQDYKYAQIQGKESWAQNGFSDKTPLPFGSVGGDSGSPYFAWNDSTGDFELLLAHTGSFNAGELMDADALPRWSQNMMESYNVHIDMSRTDGTVVINGVQKEDDKGGAVSEIINGQSISVVPCYGYLSQGNQQTVTDASGNAVRYIGVESGTYTWNSLTDKKDEDNWYAYGNGYLNASASVDIKDKEAVITEGLTYAKLYQTQNLVFDAAESGKTYNVKVSQETDLGVGYLHFAADKLSNITFNVSSDNGTQVHSAGYVVDEGVQVNVSLRNTDAEYMREWRKVGEGILNICGEGSNEIFLNVGGKGETLLNQKEGYAAYNVLANTGSTVRIKDTSQIHRDFTFGNGGAILDMNGNSMDWYVSKGEERTGAFTIHALTEEAVISNSAAQKAVLTFKEGSKQQFVGSFRDSATSALGIVYEGGDTWELNSIRTKLEHKDSGLTVKNGTVRLAGTHTVHGFYGANQTTDVVGFATRGDDWHYADAAMNVMVEQGGVFELASHARLTGDVSVKKGGTYIMREGVNHAEEYIEGGEKKESTGGEVAKYYGHWGDVELAEGAKMQVSYTDGTDTATTYTGKVSGPGTLTVDLGTDAAAFVLEGAVCGVSAVDVVGKSKLELGSNVSIAAWQAGDAAFTKVQAMNKKELSGSAQEQLTMKNVQMVVAEGQEYTISHARLEGSYIDALAGATLKLSNVYVAAGSYLTDAPATLVADAATLQVVVGTNATAQPLTLGGALSVEAPGGADKATVAATDKVLQITSSVLDTFTVTGSLLTVDLTGSEWSYDGTALTLNGEAVGDWIALSFDTEDKEAAVFDKDLTVVLTFSGIEALADVRLAGYYNVAETAPSTVYFQTRYIPEPSTATLSMLALAALCARRRRTF